jgi:hypothetical protein
MRNPASLGSLRNCPGHSVVRWFGLTLLLLALGLTAGCGGSGGAKNEVTGKVTLGDKTVAGTVTFVYADGREVVGPINPDGTYLVTDPPPGQVKICVKGLPGGGTGLPGPKGGPEMSKDMPTTQGAGVSPPIKYAHAGTTPLTYEVKAGKHTHDLQLK